MNRVISLISIIITVSVTSLFADECPQYIPQTPEAQAVARSIDFPVNLYTGIPGISIPIYEIKCGSLCVPISLDYQAGGIVPSQEATSVGLGWRINAGGAITRTIKCADDFCEKYENNTSPFRKSFFYDYSNLSTKDIKSCISDKTLIADSEPDIYYYSIPGCSGKFTYRRNKELLLFDKSVPLSIRTNFGRPSFEITDSEGNIYYFEDWAKDSIRNYSFSGALPNDAKSINTINDGYDYGEGIWTMADDFGFGVKLELRNIYASCWHLTKIISPTHDTIFFNYKRVAYQLPLEESCNKKTLLLMGPNNYPYEDMTGGSREEISYTRSKSVVFSQQLTEIRWRGGCVKFIEDKNSREDLKSYHHSNFSGPRAISKIIVCHKTLATEQDSVVRTCSLSYDYFNNDINGKLSHLFKRLKLKRIVTNTDDYSFAYNEEERLPAKNTKNTDYWGYYNGKDQGSDYYCSGIYRNKQFDDSLVQRQLRKYNQLWYITDKSYFDGANKDADEHYCKVGILEQIRNTSGGVTKFNYECNQIAPKPEPQEKFRPLLLDSIGGNGRCERVRHTLNKKKTLLSLIMMTSGSSSSFAGWDAFVVSKVQEDGTKTLVNSWPMGANDANAVNLVLEPGEYEFLANATVNNIKYEMIIAEEDIDEIESPVGYGGGLRIASIEGEKNIRYEYQGGIEILSRCNSIIRTEFQDSGDAYNHYLQKRYLMQYSESVRSFSSLKNGTAIGYSKVTEIYPNGTKVQSEFHNERELLQSYFYAYSPSVTDWENGLLLKKTQFNSDSVLITETVNTYTIKDRYSWTDAGFIFNPNEKTFFYDYKIDYPILTKTRTRERLENGLSVNTSLFEYNDKFLLSKKTTKQGYDDGEVLTLLYKYPSDFSDAVSKDLSYLQTPIATISYRNGKMIDVDRVAYERFSLDKNMLNYHRNSNEGNINHSNGQEDELILPAYRLRLNTSSVSEDLSKCTYDTIVEYNSYTFHGNPQEYRYKGTPITCLWGYNGLYAIAEFKNATFSQVAEKIPYVKALYWSNSIGENTRYSIANQNIEGSASTICQYLPLVGVTNIIDSKGMAFEYKYDYLCRLSQIFQCGDYTNMSSVSPILVTSYEYEKGKRVTTKTYLNGRSVYQGTRYSPWEDFATYVEGSSTDYIVATQYYDQWGRASFVASQGNNPEGKYLCGLQTYDALGRPFRNWLAVPLHDNTLSNMSEEDFRELSAEVLNDHYGYTETTYNDFGQPKSESIPGKTWYDKGKFTKQNYLVNKANEVKKYVVSDNCPENQGFYLKGDLFCSKTTDADGLVVKKYTDFWGNVVLERKGENNDTYYVYDDYNRLRFVLQPMYQSEANLDKYAFEYKYDGKGLVVYKKIPGCQPVLYNYDSADRLIWMQDGIMGTEKSHIFEYDGLGRMTAQGISNGKKVDYEIRNYYDKYDFIDVYSYLLPNNMQTVCPDERAYGKGQLTGVWQKASNGEELLTTFSYDEYGRLSHKSEIGLGKHLSKVEFRYNYVGDVKKELFEEYDYDKKVNAPILVLDGYIENKYDLPHTKLLTSSVITINDIANGKTMTDTIHKPTYDEFGRIIADDRSGIAPDMVYEYDKVHGWLTSVKGGMEMSKYGYSMVQNLYRETESSKPCWNGSISAMEWSTTPLNLYRYDYYYDDLNRLIGSVYSAVDKEKTVSSAENAAPFRENLWDEEEEEEPLNLLEKSTGNLIPESDNGEILEYDANSNIKSIKRYGYNPNQYGNNGVLIDDLEIRYNGNQKTKVDDFAETVFHSGAFDFKDDADQEVEYSYDENGNLIYDANKDLHFNYDLLGHLVSVEGSKSSIEYVYSADGRKLRTIHNQYVDVAKKKLLTTTQKDYQGNLIYKNGLPEMYQFDGGYYAFANGILKNCYFYIKDYQGNIRLLADNKKSCSQRLSYYPYGTTLTSSLDNKQDFKYSGKELDRTYGLDLYDFHARQYDPILGCFTSIDPMAEKYYSISPYSYCAGDPINSIDPTGQFICVADSNNICYTYDIKDKCFKDEKGNVYSGNDGFIKEVAKQLSTLCEGKTGEDLVTKLVSNEKGVQIIKSRNGNNSESSWTPYYNSNIVSGILFSGTSIVQDGTAYTSLGHELVHAYDRIIDNLDLGIWIPKITDDAGIEKDITYSEIHATFIENKIRKEHNLNLRNYYIKNDYTRSTLIDSKGRSLYYDNRGNHLPGYSKIKDKNNRYQF